MTRVGGSVRYEVHADSAARAECTVRTELAVQNVVLPTLGSARNAYASPADARMPIGRPRPAAPALEVRDPGLAGYGNHAFWSPAVGDWAS